MPGDVTNHTILRAMNQTIQAINDIAVLMADCCHMQSVSDMGTQSSIDEPVSEGGEPPDERFGNVSIDEYGQRKCKVANLLVDDILAVCVELEKVDLVQILQLGTGVATGIIASVLAYAAIFLSGPIGWVFAVAGVIIGCVAVYIEGAVEIDELISNIQTNRTSLVCSLYSSSNPTDAVDAFCAVLSSGGASSADLAFIRSVFLVAAAEWLYYSYTGDGGAWESKLASYTGSVDCSVCGIEYWVAWGKDNGDGEIESVDQGDQHVISFIVNGVGWVPGQRSEVTVSIISGTIGSSDDKGYRLYGESASDLNKFYEDNDAPSWPICLRGCDLTNESGGIGTPFSIQLTKGSNC